MLLYLAGLYTVGNIDENITTAREHAMELWERGYTVICPHLNTAHFEQDCKCTYEDYMRGDLEMIARVDAVVMLPHWKKSPGATREREFAVSRNIPVYEFDEVPPISVVEAKKPKQCSEFINIIMNMYRVHLAKNADYSSANILGTGKVGLVTRMWDKMARLMNLTGFRIEISESVFEKPTVPKHESISDNVMDLTVYGVIFQLEDKGVWGK